MAHIEQLNSQDVDENHCCRQLELNKPGAPPVLSSAYCSDFPLHQCQIVLRLPGLLVQINFMRFFNFSSYTCSGYAKTWSHEPSLSLLCCFFCLDNSIPTKGSTMLKFGSFHFFSRTFGRTKRNIHHSKPKPFHFILKSAAV